MRRGSNTGEGRGYYGWVVVAACFVLLIGSFGTQLSFTVFLKPLTEQFGWSRAAASGAMSVLMGVAGVIGVVMGKVTDKYNPRIVVAAGMVIGTASYLLLATIDSLWALYLLFGVGGGIYAGSTYTPVSATVSKWFTERRTLALGIALIGIVVGQMVLSPVAAAVIDARGWRTAYIVLGCAAFVCALPALFLFGRAPAGAARTGREAPGARPGLTGLSVRQAARTAPFWMLMVTGFVISVGFYMMAAHMVPYATDEGVANTTAALIMTISSIGGIAGSLSAWYISKRLGQKQALATFLAGEAVALFLFLVTRSAWSFIVVAMIWSFAFSCASPARMAMAAPLFGLRSVGSILGVATLAFSVGGIAGPFLGGYIYDRRGSYSLALVIGGVLLVIGSATAYVFGSRRIPDPMLVTSRPKESL